MYHLFPATEAIMFQPKSKLAKELVETFDEMNNYIAEYDKARPEKLSKSEDIKRHDNAMKYFKKTITPKVQKIIKKYTNINVSKIIPVHPSWACGLFSVDLGMDAVDAIILSMQKMSGTTSFSKGDLEVEHLDDLINMSKQVDLKKGRLKTDKINKSLKVEVPITMDIGLAFFRDDVQPNTEKLTSEEVTAILLHELGHVMTLLEHLGDVIHGSGKLFTTYEAIKSGNIKNKQVKEVVTTLKNYTDTLEEGPIKAASEKGLSIIEQLGMDKAFKDKYSIINKYISPILGSAFLTIFVIFVLPAIFVTYGLRVCNSMEDHKHLDNNSVDYSKTSDVMYTDRNKYFIERVADEYVVRHGMASHLGSGLQKVISFGESVGFTGVSSISRNMNKSVFMSGIMKFNRVIANVFDMGLTKSSKMYEDVAARNERLVENYMVAFKNPRLPKDVRDHYISEVMSLQKTIKEEKSVKSRKVRDALWETIFNVDLFANIYSSIKSGRLPEKMKVLLNTLDTFSNNILYFQKARLEKLLDKK